MSMGKAIADAVFAVAPTVGGALAGPAGALVAQELSQRLTGRPDTPEAALRTRLTGNISEDDKKALLALETEYTRRLEIAADDRANARAMHIEKDGRAPHILTAASGLGFVGMLILLTFEAPPIGSESIIYGGVGTLGMIFTMCAAFFVGSSTDSRKKTDMLAGRR